MYITDEPSEQLRVWTRLDGRKPEDRFVGGWVWATEVKDAYFFETPLRTIRVRFTDDLTCVFSSAPYQV